MSSALTGGTTACSTHSRRIRARKRIACRSRIAIHLQPDRKGHQDAGHHDTVIQDRRHDRASVFASLPALRVQIVINKSFLVGSPHPSSGHPSTPCGAGLSSSQQRGRRGQRCVPGGVAVGTGGLARGLDPARTARIVRPPACPDRLPGRSPPSGDGSPFDPPVSVLPPTAMPAMKWSVICG
jgi:hypothetical protein